MKPMLLNRVVLHFQLRVNTMVESALSYDMLKIMILKFFPLGIYAIYFWSLSFYSTNNLDIILLAFIYRIEIDFNNNVEAN